MVQGLVSNASALPRRLFVKQRIRVQLMEAPRITVPDGTISVAATVAITKDA